uniref:Uncharacterized protein n=1 Tax=Vitis vinifera TaxID=29760 RepID=A5B5K1_VITVI|nr:hypothetical protein VITISV_012729 [Vitis vinifera]
MEDEYLLVTGKWLDAGLESLPIYLEETPSIRFHFNSLTDATCNGLSLSLSLNHPRNHFARENGVCEISQTLKRAAKYFRINKLNSQGCEVGFHLEVPSFPLVVYVGQLQKEIHPTVQKGCGITSQQKGDFAALCKMLPSARSDWLATAATSSFQLRIVHRLKHWIFEFLSFEMVYRMYHLDFRKYSKSGCYDCHQEYASWQILFTFSPCNPDLLLANDF